MTLSPDALLRRNEAANALNEAGYPISAHTLKTMATRGGGPAYRVFGRAVLYRWGDVMEWAAGRLTPPRASTSERDALFAPRTPGTGRRAGLVTKAA